MKRIDLAGQRFGRLTVLEFSHKGNNGQSYWNCQCDCGNKKIESLGHLRSGSVKSCGCLRNELLIQRNDKKLAGKKFGKLEVVREYDVKNRNRRWLCKCDCGNSTVTTTSKLLNGKIKSCGCLSSEVASKKAKKYNQYGEIGSYMFGISSNTGRKFLFDKDDYEKIKGYCWREANNGYIISQETGSDKCVLFHRIITDALEGQIVDHINHNTLDNRKNNLRIGTQENNMMNAKLKSSNTSGNTGVWLDNRTGKWVAEIKVNKTKISLGHFTNKSDAISTRKKAEEEYFGDWSYEKSKRK